MLRVLSLIMSIFLFSFSSIASAADKKETVISMMDSAISHYQEVGEEQAFKDFSVKDSEYNKGEFYIFITEMTDFNLVFHGANAKLVGKNLSKLKDTDGKPFVIAMREVAQGPGEGWVTYKWTHPVTKKITPKKTYVKKTGNVYFGIGYFE